MSETRLVELSAEDAARLRLIADHEGNDLSPNDHGLLLALADARFDGGITEEEARESADWIMGHRPETNSLAVGIALDRAVSKLRSAFREADKDG